MCPERRALAPWKWEKVVALRRSSTLVFFVLFWQNQLLAKGLLFVEEKIKLYEGKYKAALIDRGPWDSAFDVWTAEALLSKSGRLQVSDSARPLLPQRGGGVSV